VPALAQLLISSVNKLLVPGVLQIKTESAPAMNSVPPQFLPTTRKYTRTNYATALRLGDSL
jgi:hypothetical protein